MSVELGTTSHSSTRSGRCLPTGSWTPTLQSSRLHLKVPVNNPKDEAGDKDKAPLTAEPLQRSRQQTLSSGRFPAVERRFPRLTAAVRSERFEAVVGIAIVANCVTMGLEAEQLLGRAVAAQEVVHLSEHFFTAFFVIELCLRCFVHGWRTYTPFQRWGGRPSNFFDAMLVLVTGVFIVWVLPLFGKSSGGFLQTLTVLRAFRLMRLVRVVQRVEAFHEVWLLLRGLSKSGSVLFWTVSVIFCITYIFAIFGVALIGVRLQAIRQDKLESQGFAGEELDTLVEVTGGVWAVMYTLIQVLTLDSWTSIARPIMSYVPGSWAFFYLYIAVAVIVMMNLVTAVIVENALKSSQQDEVDILAQREKDKQVGLSRLHSLFERMDVDGDNELNWQEFELAFEDEELCSRLKLYGIERESCSEVFNLLDSGDGVISMEEFFEGISKMEGPALAADLFRNTKLNELLVKLILQQNQELQEDLQELLRHTPGASMRLRPDNLRGRACRTPAKELFMDYIGDRGTSPTRSHPIPSPCMARSSQLSPEKPFGLPGTTSSADADGPAPSCHACNDELLARIAAAMEACDQRLTLLAAEVANFGPADAALPVFTESDASDQSMPPIAPKLPGAPPALVESGQSRPRSAWRQAARPAGSPGKQAAEAGAQALNMSASTQFAHSTAAEACKAPISSF